MAKTESVIFTSTAKQVNDTMTEQEHNSIVLVINNRTEAPFPA